MEVGVPELLIVLVVVLLLFGPGRIARMAGEIGKGVRNFREGLKGEGDEMNENAPEDKTTKP